MKFRYYIFTDGDFTVEGTDDKEVAMAFTKNPDCLVVDAQDGNILVYPDKVEPVKDVW